jgi:NhaP-type Na+/H+ or K+/H+ antiporter
MDLLSVFILGIMVGAWLTFISVLLIRWMQIDEER